MSGKVNEFHWHYQVYGQRLCSGVPLPELLSSDFHVRDLRFHSVSTNGDDSMSSCSLRLLSQRDTNLGSRLSVFEGDTGLLLRFEGLCDFHISTDGREIKYCSTSDTDLDWIRSTLYSMVIPFTMHLRGLRNLHASVVVLAGRAVGFLAGPGTGKSTLASAFAAKGYPCLTDDVLALRESPEGYTAYPGLPFVSLSEHSINSLIGPQIGSERTSLNGLKERVALDGRWASFWPEPTPLRCLYVLNRVGDMADINLEAMSVGESILSLLENTNCLPALPTWVLKDHLAFLGKLVRSVPVWRLTYPTGFQQIPTIIARVLERQTGQCHGNWRMQNKHLR